MMKNFSLLLLLTTIILYIGTTNLYAETDQSHWPLFAFDNGVGRDQGWEPEQQAKLLSKLDYDGIGYSGLRNVGERLRAMKAENLRVFSFYEPCFLDKPEALDPKSAANLRKLEGTNAVLWLLMQGETSETEAVAKLTEIARHAGAFGIKVAIYPHDNTYVETGEHALRLVKLVDEDNFGMSINVCHELKAGNGDQLHEIADEAGDSLFLVSINGADQFAESSREKNWQRLIQPVGKGDFDLKPLLNQLRESEYSGPIGVQCYQIEGEIEPILQTSKDGWSKLLLKLD
jgi:sugar phosphate isomerase/epimerase